MLHKTVDNYVLGIYNFKKKSVNVTHFSLILYEGKDGSTILIWIKLGISCINEVIIIIKHLILWLKVIIVLYIYSGIIFVQTQPFAEQLIFKLFQ